MADPTFVEQLAGIASAGTALILIGMLSGGLDRLTGAILSEESINRRHGYIPGVLEPAKNERMVYDGLAPLPFAFVAGIGTTIATYVACGLVAVVVIGVASLAGLSVGSYPALWFGAALAVLVGLHVALEVDRQLRKPDGLGGW